MRRLLRARPAARTRLLPGRWLAALLITGVMALLVPGVSYATASQSSPASQSSRRPPVGRRGCLGVTPAVIPALGFVTNPQPRPGWPPVVAS